MSVLFGWAVKKGYVAENPCTKIEKPTVDRQPPVIFVPTQALSLLKVARELTPWVVVGLFAGLRPDEAKRLSWEDVDFKRRHIDLPPDKAKGRRRRIIPFLGNLEAWLLPYQRKTGSIVPANFRRRFWKMAERAGFREEKNSETERRQNRKAEPPAGWPKDVLRHSFGSYHLAAHKSASLTAELMGNLQCDGQVAADAYFCAEQNALIVRDAEQYYRTMFRREHSSWNQRDTTLPRLDPRRRGLIRPA